MSAARINCVKQPRAAGVKYKFNILLENRGSLKVT
jgi:hypothetical protein